MIGWSAGTTNCQLERDYVYKNEFPQRPAVTINLIQELQSEMQL
jgi:hypothetical protein